MAAAETKDCLAEHDAVDGVAENLAGAVDALEADAPLMDAVGRQLCNNHIFIKRDEIIKTAALEGDALRDFYIHFI